MQLGRQPHSNCRDLQTTGPLALGNVDPPRRDSSIPGGILASLHNMFVHLMMTYSIIGLDLDVSQVSNLSSHS